jgi:GAF domain-containing protein
MSSISDPPSFERAGLARDTGVAACLGLPIMVNGRVIAVIAVYDTSSREYDEQIVELSQTVTEAATNALNTTPKFAGEF